LRRGPAPAAATRRDRESALGEKAAVPPAPAAAD